MAFKFKNIFKQPSKEETLEKISKLQQEEKALSLQEKIFSKKVDIQDRVTTLRKKKFQRSVFGRGLKVVGKVGSALAKGSGNMGDVDLFESPGRKKKLKNKSSDDDLGVDLGF